MNATIALAVSALTLHCPSGPMETTADAGCICPELSSGWVLFGDASRRVPDFWCLDSLEVQEITLCEHGISFVFVARDGGNLYLSSLLLVDPAVATPRLAEKVARRGGDPELRREKYARIVAEVGRLSGGALRTGGVIDLRRVARDEKAWILSPSARLSLHWRGQEVVLRGYLDVYLSAIV